VIAAVNARAVASRHHAARHGYPHRLRERALSVLSFPSAASCRGRLQLVSARIVGISQALEWCYTGRVFAAQEALAGRLVSKVVPPDELLPTARALARKLPRRPARCRWR